MKSLTEFKEMAFKKFRLEKKEISFTDPISFLYSLSWDIPYGPSFSEDEVSQMNIDLDERGCFGRAVKAAVLSEQYFPEERILFGEVCQDFLACRLIYGAKDENWFDVTYLDEILQYEDPHSIIVWKGKQFDPLFKMLSSEPQMLEHLTVIKHDLWKGLYCSYLVSESLLAKKRSIRESFEILLTAIIICPEMILLKENLVAILSEFGQFNQAIRLAKEVLIKRENAWALFVLWTLTKDDSYKNQILIKYSESMFNHLNSDL